MVLAMAVGDGTSAMTTEMRILVDGTFVSGRTKDDVGRGLLQGSGAVASVDSLETVLITSVGRTRVRAVQRIRDLKFCSNALERDGS